MKLFTTLLAVACLGRACASGVPTAPPAPSPLEAAFWRRVVAR